jgi:hypothetical protein
MLAMATASDDELLCAFAAGDSEAFGTFYRRHLPAVLGFFLRRTGDPELTADAGCQAPAAAVCPSMMPLSSGSKSSPCARRRPGPRSLRGGSGRVPVGRATRRGSRR